LREQRGNQNANAKLVDELAPSKITINSLAPGAIETPINTQPLNDPVKLKSCSEIFRLEDWGNRKTLPE